MIHRQIQHKCSQSSYEYFDIDSYSVTDQWCFDVFWNRIHREYERRLKESHRFTYIHDVKRIFTQRNHKDSHKCIYRFICIHKDSHQLPRSRGWGFNQGLYEGMSLLEAHQINIKKKKKKMMMMMMIMGTKVETQKKKQKK